MSREAVETLMDRWMDDSAFRTAMRRDPEGTVRESGADLDADEWAALRNVDWNLSDEQLRSRARQFLNRAITGKGMSHEQGSGGDTDGPVDE